MVTIAVIGDGGWGTTLSLHLREKGDNVRLWSVSAEYAAVLDKQRVNAKFLPGIKIPADIIITADMAAALAGAEYVVLAVPAQYLRQVLQQVKGLDIKDKIFINVAKGVELSSLSRMSEVIRAELGRVKLAVFSGPTIAKEVARHFPAAMVAAASDLKTAKKVQTLFAAEYLRVYAGTDVTGVELGGSLKNIIAIAAGICDGLGFGANTKAALITRGLVEITRFGTAQGAKKETFQGLSGLGDLVVTSFSPDSRNRWFGEQIGLGRKTPDILRDTQMVVEGVKTTESIYQLAGKLGIETPIITEIYNVLCRNKDPKTAVLDLMCRERKVE